MAVYVAFLRAINVGNRRVSMERLRAPFEDRGFDDVSTFIASGNVIFTAGGKAADLEADVEHALEDALGFEVRAFVRTPSRIGRIVNDQPFGRKNDDLVHVGLLKKSPGAAIARSLRAASTETDEVTTKGKALYWLARGGMGRATISGAALEKILKQPTTFRSLKMLRRLHDKLT